MGFATGARRQTQTLIYPEHTRTDTRFTYENEPGNLPGLTGLRTQKIHLSHFNRHQAERQVTHANHRPSTVPTAGICYPPASGHRHRCLLPEPPPADPAHMGDEFRDWPRSLPPHQWTPCVARIGTAPCAGGGVMTAAINRLLLVLWCAAPSRWFRKGGRK